MALYKDIMNHFKWRISLYNDLHLPFSPFLCSPNVILSNTVFKIVAVNIVLEICLRKHSNLMENMVFNLWLSYLFLIMIFAVLLEEKLVSVLTPMLITMGQML